MTDFYKNIYDAVRPFTDTHDKFIQAIALHVSAVCFGRFYKIQDSHFKRPNLYIILSSPPGIARRGEIQRCASIIRKASFEEFNKDNAENEIFAHSLEGGSAEGFADDIIDLHKKGHESICTSSTEWGAVLSSINRSGSYMEGLPSLICQLWSGESYTGSLSHRKGGTSRFIPEGIYFNMFNGCQMIEHYINDSNSQTGFVRRLLIFSVRGKDLTEWLPPVGADDQKLKEDLTEIGTQVGERMKHLHSSSVITYGEDVKNEVEVASYKRDMDARKDDENPYTLYQQTEWEQYLKIAANLALLRESQEITAGFFEGAMMIRDNAAPDIQRILESSLTPPKMKNVHHHMDLIVKYIKNGFTMRDISHRMSSYGVHATKASGESGVYTLAELLTILQHDDRIIKDEKSRSGWREL